MTGSDKATLKAEILILKIQIEDSRRKLHDRIEHIRERAENDERDAIDRHYAEIRPMERLMSSLILALVDYESLKNPSPVLVEKTA